MKIRNFLLALIPSMLPLVLVALPMVSTLVAQDPVLIGQPVPVPVGGAPGMGMPSEGAVGGARKFQLLNQYAIEIHRIHATAKLDDAQKSKLAAGAKTLAEEKAQEFAKTMNGMMHGAVMPVGAIPGTPSKPKADGPKIKLAEVKSYADVDQNTKFMLENGFAMQATQRDDADWLKLVKSVLKSEQYVKYEQAIAAQKQIIAKTMVEAGMATLSVDLVLSKEQESKLAALALEQLAKPKEAINPNDPAAMAMGMVVGAMSGQQSFFMELAKVDSKKIRDVLDPQQFDLLDLKLELYRLIGAMQPGVIITQ